MYVVFDTSVELFSPFLGCASDGEKTVPFATEQHNTHVLKLDIKNNFFAVLLHTEDKDSLELFCFDLFAGNPMIIAMEIFLTCLCKFFRIKMHLIKSK